MKTTSACSGRVPGKHPALASPLAAAAAGAQAPAGQRRSALKGHGPVAPPVLWQACSCAPEARCHGRVAGE
eukprot:11171118-Lingulodinium_polyedra.AAC.1